MNPDPRSPRVTVVIPTHDRASLLREAVGSVLAQTLRQWELVIVDDCSADETPAFVEGLDDPRIRGVRLDVNVERSAARNRGLREVRAPFVLFLDDDDHLLPSALDQLVRGLGDRPGAVAAVGGRLMVRPDGVRRRAAHPGVRRVRDVRTDLFFDWVGFPSQTLFRSDAVKGLGGWNEDLTRGEDRELWLRIARHGPAVFIPTPVAEWRMREAPAVPDQQSAAARRSRLLAARAATVQELGADPELRTLLEASTRWVDGMNAYEAGRYREASAAFVDACRLAPGAIVSPLVGSSLRRMMVRAFLGGIVGARTATRARGLLRRGSSG